ncbi:MAG: DUF3413 domain-containing protein [Venatoribacter sp.]
MLFKQKLIGHSWFALVNALLAIAISTRYFQFLPVFPSDFLGVFFLVTATFSHLVLLVVVLAVISAPALLLTPKLSAAIRGLVAAVGLVFLYIDTLVFAQYRFHINGVVLELVMSGDVVDFPLVTWVSVILGLVAVIGIEYILAYKLSQYGGVKRSPKPYLRVFFATALVCLLASNVVHVWAYAHSYQSVTKTKRYLPSFYPLTANKFMKKIGWINEEELKRQQALTQTRKGDIQYPLKPLQTVKVDHPTNILLLVIDSWRYDTFSEDNTPNLWKFAHQGVIFNQHLSTGNATRSGIFGLFYGMPATYWETMLNNRTSPVLMDRLQELNYQIGIFGSAHLRNPEFNQTAFVKVPNLREESQGQSPSQRDRNLTDDWLTWHKNTNSNQPKFSFLFYDAAHGYDFPKNYPKRYEPMFEVVDYLKLNKDSEPTLLKNRYKTSVHYIDSLISEVLEQLKSSGELDNTLVVITGDHSQEMNDNKQNYWGHGSNFTYAQVHVPFALVGPKLEKLGFKETQQLSDHQNLVPTLMQEYLGVTSEVSTYSTGKNWFSDSPQRPWVISGNFNGYALVEPERILEINMAGQYELLDSRNQPLKDSSLNTKQLQEAIEMMSRFNP